MAGQCPTCTWDGNGSDMQFLKCKLCRAITDIVEDEKPVWYQNFDQTKLEPHWLPGIKLPSEHPHIVDIIFDDTHHLVRLTDDVKPHIEEMAEPESAPTPQVPAPMESAVTRTLKVIV